MSVKPKKPLPTSQPNFTELENLLGEDIMLNLFMNRLSHNQHHTYVSREAVYFFSSLLFSDYVYADRTVLMRLVKDLKLYYTRLQDLPLNWTDVVDKYQQYLKTLDQHKYEAYLVNVDLEK